MLDLPLDSLPAIPEKRNNEPRHRWFRIPAVRRSRADTPRQRVFRGCPADAVLAIDMATGSVWIRGNDPNGWVPLDIPELHPQIPSQFQRSAE